MNTTLIITTAISAIFMVCAFEYAYKYYKLKAELEDVYKTLSSARETSERYANQMARYSEKIDAIADSAATASRKLIAAEAENERLKAKLSRKGTGTKGSKKTTK